MTELATDCSIPVRQHLKQLMVENLMLQVAAQEIGDEQPLFGPGSLGLDSVDALQLVVALDKKYGLKIPDPERAREVLRNVKTMAEAVAAHLAASPGRD
jgi:acyl carrier protein